MTYLHMPIVYEDSSLLVINKPAGVIVNRSDTTRGVHTVQDFVDSHLHIKHSIYKEIRKSGEFQSPEEAFDERSGIVHRLDKETSGVLLIAKTPEAFAALQKEFKDRVVKKTYVALSHGKILPADGEINVPVGRLEFNRKRFGVTAGGRESVTHYHVLQYLQMPSYDTKQKEEFSLVELYPKTGRTHQIRVHLQYIHHPIFGDEFYAGRKVARNDRKILPRVFLHAYKISFVHPTTGKEMHLQAELPEELQGVLDSLVQK